MNMKDEVPKSQSQKIIARACRDWAESMDGEYIGIVVESDHPRYKEGEKLDLHRIWFAIHDGYTVEIKPAI